MKETTTNIIAFANNMVVTANTERELQNNLKTSNSGLNIYIGTTNVIVIAREHVECHITVKNQSLERKKYHLCRTKVDT